MNLRSARKVADALVEQWAPACERVEIAGSIRREKPDVKDIELVAIPRWEAREAGQSALFDGPPVERANLLQERIEAEDRLALLPIKPGTHEIVPWHLTPGGRYWRLYLPPAGLKVDLFLASVETWGLTYTIRTGSSDFSMAMLARWKQVTGGGYSREALLHWPNGRVEHTPEEADVFRACMAEWIEPRHRLDAKGVHA